VLLDKSIQKTQELDMKIKTKVRAGRAGCGTIKVA